MTTIVELEAGILWKLHFSPKKTGKSKTDFDWSKFSQNVESGEANILFHYVCVF